MFWIKRTWKKLWIWKLESTILVLKHKDYVFKKRKGEAWSNKLNLWMCLVDWKRICYLNVPSKRIDVVRHYFQDVSFYDLTKIGEGSIYELLCWRVPNVPKTSVMGQSMWLIFLIPFFLNRKIMGASKHINLVSLQFLLGILVDMLNIFPQVYAFEWQKKFLATLLWCSPTKLTWFHLNNLWCKR